MMIATTIHDNKQIQEDADVAREFMDAVDDAIEGGLSYGVLVNDEDNCGIFGYEKDQFLSACEAYGLTEEELLAQFLSEKIGGDSENIDVVFLNVEN